MTTLHDLRFTGTDESLVRTVLDEYGELTRRGVQEYLPHEEPGSYLYELLADYPRRGGKMMRSSLCIAMAHVTGASIDDAIASAVSIELMHNALLVHDDSKSLCTPRRADRNLDETTADFDAAHTENVGARSDN